MRRFVSALMVGVTMLVMTGCGVPMAGNGAEPARTDFWGNEIPADTPDDSGACPNAVVPPIPPHQAPYRPADVRPGNAWIAVELEVRALGMGIGGDVLDNEFCVPVIVHVYNRSGEADTLSLNGLGFESGPFDFVSSTPWGARWVALQYDPTEQRFQGRPPTYEIHLDTTYDGERDIWTGSVAIKPLQLSCALKIDGATIVRQTVPIERGVTTGVQCTFRSNDYWKHY